MQRLDIPTSLVRPVRNSQPVRQLVVVYPPDYDLPTARSTRYPVLYLLHGSPGSPENFINYGHWPSRMADLVQAGKTQSAIMVIPDGNYAGEHHGDSEWANSFDRRDLYEDFVAKDVVGWVDAHLRSIPDAAHRILAGVSEGGYGAVNVAMRNPGVFGSAISFSGYFRNDGSGWARPAMGSDPKFLEANSPLDYVGSGLGGGRDRAAWRDVRFFLGVGADEKRYFEETKAMAGRLQDEGLAVTLQVAKGKHGWGLWDQLFDTLMPAALPPVSPADVKFGQAAAESVSTSH